jgi:hypothetical protein
MGSEWIIGRLGCGLDSSGSGQGLVAGCCECSDEPSGSYATESELIHFNISLLLTLCGNEGVWLKIICIFPCWLEAR